MLAIGIDVGGTKIAGGVVDDSGSIVASKRVQTPASDAGRIKDVIAAMIEEFSTTYDVVAAGVAIAGLLDRTRSVVYYAPNINLRDEPLRASLEQRTHVPMVIENDANAAGWGEYRFGAGRGIDDVVMLTIGTGVGGAIISDGRLLRGGYGLGGEIGHIRLVPDGLLCGCGQRGCLEQYGSGRALIRFADEIADGGHSGDALAHARERDGELNGRNLRDLLERGDPGALAALDRLGEVLGAACASMTAALDPRRFVVGGGVSEAGERLLGTVRAVYRAHLPARGYRPEPDFRIAELANNAGVVGVADLARQAHEIEDHGRR